MALRGTVNAVGPMQTGIEPLRGVWRGNLRCQHETQLVIEGPGIRFSVKIAAFPAPIGPGPGKTVENLPGIHLRPETFSLWQGFQPRCVGFVRPQPGRHIVFFHGAQFGRHPGFPEIFLRDDVAGNLAPVCGNRNVSKLEHGAAVGILDLTRHRAEFDSVVR